jgi:hypothetical protein
MQAEIKHREYDKFREALNGLSKVAVTIEQDEGSSIPIQVNESPDLPAGYLSVSRFFTQLSVPTGVETVLASIIVAEEYLLLESIEVSGTNKARFNIYLNDDLIATRRTNYLDFATEFRFISYKLAQTDKIEVKVYHERPFVGDFEARIIGVAKS